LRRPEGSTIPWLVLAAIYAYVLANLVPFLLYNNLLKGDGPGHLMLLDFTARHLLPTGIGWCDTIWLGFPAGQLYPPLFHILAGAVSLATGPVAAAKIVAAATWAALPAAAFLVARALFRSHIERAIGLMALWAGLNLPSAVLDITEALGSNIESGLGQGMFPSSLGALFFLLLMWRLARRAEPSKIGIPRPEWFRWTPYPDAAVLLALSVLSHPVWGVAGALATACAVLPPFLQTREVWPPPRPSLTARLFSDPHPVRTVLSAALAFGLTGFFSIPFLAHRDLMIAIHLPSHWPLGLWLLAGIVLLPGIWLLHHMSRSGVSIWISAALTCAAIAVGDVAGLRTHVFRWSAPALMLVLLLLPLVISAARSWYLFWAVAALCVLFAVLGPVHPQGNPDMDQPDLGDYLSEDGRVMVLASDMHAPGYQALPYVTWKAGASVSHGISVESAPNARYIFGLMKKLHPGIFAWGVDMHDNPATRIPDPQLGIAAGQLSALGFSHVLTDLKLPPPGDAEPAVDSQSGQEMPALFTDGSVAIEFPNYLASTREGLSALRDSFHVSDDGRWLRYVLYALPHTSLATASASFAPVSHADFDPLVDAWFAAGAQGPIPVEAEAWNASTGQPSPHCPHAKVTNLLRYQGGMAFDLGAEGTAQADPAVAADGAGEGPDRLRCPVYIKMAYHPHFSARDDRGRQLPLLRAGAGMVMLAPVGRVHLQYELGVCETAGQVLTIVSLALLIAVGVFKRA